MLGDVIVNLDEVVFKVSRSFLLALGDVSLNRGNPYNEINLVHCC